MSPLQTLIETVEAGKDWPPLYGHNDLYDLIAEALGTRDWAVIERVTAAHRGSLDAALALMKEVLPEWRLDRLRERRVGVWAARLQKRGDDNPYSRKFIDPFVENFSQNPGRALLLTTLKALKATNTRKEWGDG